MRRVVPAILIAEIGALAFLYLSFCHHIAGAYGFPLDDSWIHAHFARNIAEGKGIVYNPGQHVTSTAILYTLMLAAFYAISLKPIPDAIALGLLLHLGAAVLVYMISRRLSLTPVISAIAAIFFAAIPRLIWGALSGMEIPLYVFLTCLGIYWHIRYPWNEGWRAYLASFAFGLAALARPECAAFLVCSIADRFISYIRFDRTKISIPRFLRTLPVHLLIFAAVVAPAASYNTASYGKPLPPAFYAKTRSIDAGNMLGARIAGTATYIKESITASKRDNLLFCIMLLPGLIACVIASREQPRTGILLLPLGLLLIPAATGIAAPTGPHKSYSQLLMQHGRYSAYLCPLLSIIGAIGVTAVLSLFSKVRGAKPLLERSAIAAFAITVVLMLASANIMLAQHYSKEVGNINDMQVSLGKWAVSLPSDAVLAVNDAGAIAYFSHHRILDTVGVVNPEVVPYLNRHKNRNMGLMEYLRERKPDYVIIFPNWYPRIAARRDIFHPIRSIKLKHNVVCGGQEMVVYKPTWK